MKPDRHNFYMEGSMRKISVAVHTPEGFAYILYREEETENESKVGIEDSGSGS